VAEVWAYLAAYFEHRRGPRKPTNICRRSPSKRKVLRAFVHSFRTKKLERVIGIEPTTFSLGS